jgi:predicted transcriptional regulator YheO
MSDWADFATEVESASQNRAPGCSVGTFLNSLPGEAAESIEAALNRPEITTTAIANAISRRTGNQISSYTLRRHRRDECSCRRKIG